MNSWAALESDKRKWERGKLGALAFYGCPTFTAKFTAGLNANKASLYVEAITAAGITPKASPILK